MSHPTAARTGYRLDRQRIFLLPSRHGVSFACALTVMLIGSINYDNSLGYLLTFLLGSVALVSLLHTYGNLAGLTIRAGVPAPVFAGESAVLPLTVDNRTGGHRHAVMLVHPKQAPPAPRTPSRWPPWRRRERRAAERGVALLSLAPGEQKSVLLPVRLGRRGRIEIRALIIASRYPLGLFRAWSRIDLTPVALAYPRARGTPELPPPRPAARRDGGLSAGGQEDYSGLRDYRRGDSPKRIHWKAAARGQGLPVKLFEGAGATEVALTWEATAPVGDTERRLCQLSRWVVTAERRGLRYALEVPGVTITAALGPAHRARCLTALALYGAQPVERPEGSGAMAPPDRLRPAPAAPAVFGGAA